ncbi:hypothetical protein OHA72_32665 [Dactylosporangium sp. NBC_01737]|nr:hypothetical protein OHA72_32665 [Dactylosporangium sp. NBC_01737]
MTVQRSGSLRKFWPFTALNVVALNVVALALVASTEPGCHRRTWPR